MLLQLEEAETPKQIRGGIMHEGGAGHPSMSYFSHFSTFPTVRKHSEKNRNDFSQHLVISLSSHVNNTV